jgi:DeoR family transcriptional regulator of aga operon
MGVPQNELADARLMPPEERRRRIAERVREAGSVTVAMLEQEFSVSSMTARRDLAALEQEGKLRRTHGGAVLVTLASHEDSFQYRLEEAGAAKRRLAAAALSLVEPGQTIYIDSSTTAYFAAREILARRLRVTLLTNSLAVTDLWMSNESQNVDLVSTGGTLRKLTLSFVGPHAVRTVEEHFADKVLLSVKGVTTDGFLTDPDPLEAEVKRAMIKRSEQPILLLDGSKFGQRGMSAVAHIADLSFVIVADAPEEALHSLGIHGAEVRSV